MPAMYAAGLKFFDTYYHHTARERIKISVEGVKVSPYKNTWNRKRNTSYLVSVEYFLNSKSIMVHTEPWVSFPSDLLVAKLMLLPSEVKSNA